MGTEEICFICIQETAQVVILFRGNLIKAKSSGSTTMRNALGAVIGKTQLIGYQDPALPQPSPVISWSLRMVVGSQKSEDNSPTIHAWMFPVDVNKAREFQQWLSSDPQRGMFGFWGTTVDKTQEIKEDFSAFRPLREADAVEFDFAEQSRVLTTHIAAAESKGSLQIWFTSVGGDDVLQLLMMETDTVADLLHKVATHPSCADSAVRVLLADGRLLNNMSGMMTLDKLAGSH